MKSICFALAMLVGAPAVAAEPLDLASPGGAVTAHISANEGGQPAYSLSYRGRTLIGRSALGLAFERYRTLSSGMPRSRAMSWRQLAIPPVGVYTVSLSPSQVATATRGSICALCSKAVV